MKHLTFLLSLVLLSSCSFGAPPSVSKVYKRAKFSTVKVEGEAGGGGSGFYARTKQGKLVIITNAHVCQTAGRKMIISPDGGEAPYAARTEYLDFLKDLCFLTVGESDQRIPFRIADKEAAVGDNIFVAGHPGGEPLSITSGHIMGKDLVTLPNDPKNCQPGVGIMVLNPFYGSFVCMISHQGVVMNAPIFPGNSGSPMLNDKMEVVGVAFAASTFNANAAVPLSLLKEVLAAH